MKLSSFPYIVQKEILNHLSFNNIFFLSLCSENTKKFIIQTQKYQFEKVERVHYCVEGIAMSIYVDTISCKKVTIFKMFPFPIWFNDYVTAKKNNDFVEMVKVNVLGASINFYRSTLQQSDLHVKYYLSNGQSIMETIHDRLHELLGHRTKSRVLLSEGGGVMRFLPVLRNLQKMEIRGGGFKKATFEEYLSKASCLECLSWHGYQYTTIPKIEKNSKLFELDTVELIDYRYGLDRNSELPATDVLKHFKGRHAFFERSNIATDDVVQFLNDWKSGEKFQNLEIISMRQRWDIPKIRRLVEIKVHRKEVVYSFTRKFHDEVPNYPREFKSRSYMVRESDGRVASLLLETGLIFVGVWNMTENEFLE